MGRPRVSGQGKDCAQIVSRGGRGRRLVVRVSRLALPLGSSCRVVRPRILRAPFGVPGSISLGGEEDLTLTELDLDEMIALWLSFDHHRRRTGFILSASTLGEIIEAELGPTVEFEN